MGKTFHKENRTVKVIRSASFRSFYVWRDLRELLFYTDLFLTLSLHRVRVRYKQSALGLTWALLQPLALMGIYTVIFSVVTKMPSEGVPYAVFVYAALLPWTYFSNSVSTSASSLVSHNVMITKVYFPREILPLTYVVAGFFDFLAASVVLAGLMLYYRMAVTWKILYVIPVLLVATAFIVALALTLSALQAQFRDVGMAVPLLLQIWMFASPVVYPLSAVPHRLLKWYLLNPMAGVVENFRRVVLQGVAPDLASLREAALLSAILLPASYLYFKRREATLADII